MRTEKEYLVTFIVTLVAVLVIVGGYASFSGLATYDAPISIGLAKDSFRQSDVFDADIVLRPVTFMADESLMVYVDNSAVGVVAIKKYLDDNKIEYGTEYQNAGQNNIEVLNLRDPLRVNLADFIKLEAMVPGTTHILRVEFSRGDAVAEEVFKIG
jgi:hypothetical protein